MTKRTLQDVTSGETQFVPSGTLPEPGLVGRLIRLLFGLAILFLILPGLFQSLPTLADVVEFPANLLFWVIVALTFVNMNHVINLGLGKSWGHEPQVILGVLVVISLLWSLLAYGRIWAPPLSYLLVLWLILINLPLGIAFILAAILRTPGCEMRSYHHLIARIKGQDPTEHFCPGGVDFADRWEISLRQQ